MLHNVFNIRYNSRNNWKGQLEPQNGFCSFNHVDFGIRAAYIIIRNYIRNGHNTILSIISRYAPIAENPTYHYINFVIDGMSSIYPNITVNQPLSIKDKEVIVMLLYYMMKFEGHKESKDITSLYIYNTLKKFGWK